MMRKTIKILGGAALLAIGAVSALAASKSKDEELMRARSALLWIGGTRVGDLMVGADAKLQFQFVDRTLSARIYAAPNNFPDDIVWNASYIDIAPGGEPEYDNGDGGEQTGPGGSGCHGNRKEVSAERGGEF